MVLMPLLTMVVLEVYIFPTGAVQELINSCLAFGRLLDDASSVLRTRLGKIVKIQLSSLLTILSCNSSHLKQGQVQFFTNILDAIKKKDCPCFRYSMFRQLTFYKLSNVFVNNLRLFLMRVVTSTRHYLHGKPAL